VTKSCQVAHHTCCIRVDYTGLRMCMPHVLRCRLLCLITSGLQRSAQQLLLSCGQHMRLQWEGRRCQMLRCLLPTWLTYR
jgi:hypothetical protein